MLQNVLMNRSIIGQVDNHQNFAQAAVIFDFLGVFYIEFGEIFFICVVRVDETDEINAATFPIAQNGVQAVDIGDIIAFGG